MDLLTPIVTGVVLALFTAIQARISRRRFDAFTELQHDHFEHLSGEIAAVRSNLLQLALVVAARDDPG